jgi:magnesium transporter
VEILDHVDADRIAELLERGEPFWVDLLDPSPDDLGALKHVLRLPPPAVQDSLEFSQRPKLDLYDERALLVFYGVQGEGAEAPFVEVHVHIAGPAVVTVRRRSCLHLEAARGRLMAAVPETAVVVGVLLALARSLSAQVDAISADLDRLEEDAFHHPTEMDRRRISSGRARLFRLRQVLVPQSEILADDAELLDALPGLEQRHARHPFRDVHDELVLATAAVDYARERLAEALNVYLSSVSNRLNELAARLTVFASVFLPLTFVTGFFGMNFGWMVRHIDSFGTFLVLGIVGTLVPALATALLLWRGGYVRMPPQ